MVKPTKTGPSITIRSPKAKMFQQLMEFLQQADKISPSQLKQVQQKLLTSLLHHAYATVPFYKSRLAPVFDAKGTINWERWQDIPLLQREEINTSAAEMISEKIPLTHGAVHDGETSGSTGQPIQFKYTDYINSVNAASSKRLNDWHRLDGDRKLARIRPMAAGLASYPNGIPGKKWNGKGTKGALIDLNMNTPIHLQVKWLTNIKPYYLNTFPSNVAAIADSLSGQPQKKKLINIKSILSYGEILSDEVREICKRALRADVIDCYSATELGIIAIQCPQSKLYHIQSELVFLEVLNERNQPSCPGELGRVVVTTLRNYAMPLIRYNINDYVILAESCECNRPSPVISKIAGRSRNLFHFPDGTMVLPDFKTKMWIKYLNPKQWQVAQTGPLELEIRFVPNVDADNMDFEGMSNYIHHLLRKDLVIKYRQFKAFSPSPSGKHEDYISEI